MEQPPQHTKTAEMASQSVRKTLDVSESAELERAAHLPDPAPALGHTMAALSIRETDTTQPVQDEHKPLDSSKPSDLQTQDDSAIEASDKKWAGFFDLPAEIRNRIYLPFTKVVQCHNCMQSTFLYMEHKLFPTGGCICHHCHRGPYEISCPAPQRHEVEDEHGLPIQNIRVLDETVYHLHTNYTFHRWHHFEARRLAYPTLRAPAITQVCQQMKNDTLAMFYGNQSFYICCAQDFSERECTNGSHHDKCTRTGPACEPRNSRGLDIQLWLQGIGPEAAGVVRYFTVLYGPTNVGRMVADNLVPMTTKLGMRKETPRWRQFARTCESPGQRAPKTLGARPDIYRQPDPEALMAKKASLQAKYGVHQWNQDLDPFGFEMLDDSKGISADFADMMLI